MPLFLRFLLCLILAHFPTLSLAIDSDDEDSEPSAIQLDSAAIQTSGIETLTLKPAQRHTEYIAYGKALSMQPLLALRQRYQLLLAEQNSAEARLKQAEQSRQRQQNLYRDGVTAERNLQNQQAQWQADKAQLDAKHVEIQTLNEETQLLWGEVLASWILNSKASLLNPFLSGKKTLLQITLPHSRRLNAQPERIAVAVSNERDQAQTAELISIAPNTDNNTQGQNFFFATDSKHIKAGSNLNAWLAEQTTNTTGVIIPKSALLWFMDQALVYVKTSEQRFERRTLTQYSYDPNGYFVIDALKPGEQIVVTGAQMLLSEELRGQIPDED